MIQERTKASQMYRKHISRQVLVLENYLNMISGYPSLLPPCFATLKIYVFQLYFT